MLKVFLSNFNSIGSVVSEKIGWGSIEVWNETRVILIDITTGLFLPRSVLCRVLPCKFTSRFGSITTLLPSNYVVHKEVL